MNYITYHKPASSWQEALPIGNGNTGIMLFGDLQKETLCFNDATLWSSYPHSDDPKDGFSAIQEVRKLILKGKNHQADVLAQKKLVGGWSATYLPLGNIELEFDGLPKEHYERKLDFEHAIHSVKADGLHCEAFASYPQRLCVYRLQAEKSFQLKITASSLLEHRVSIENGLTLLGNAPDKIFPLGHNAENGDNVRYNEHKAMAFALCVDVQTDGKVQYNEDNIKIKNAKEITLYFVTQTGYKSFQEMPETDAIVVSKHCQQRLRAIVKDYAALKEEHMADFSALYNQQKLTICEESNRTADEIIRLARNGGTLETLSQIMYNMGKYMLISGSRLGTQPLNLQGIWNSEIRPPWSCNYTTNINTEMNYWPASACGLSSCIEPLIRMMQESMVTGKHTANTVFGAEGFCCNHNMDIWRKTSPSMGSAQWFLSPLCGAWLTNELYKHYRNGGLEAYKDTIFSIVKENAKFLMSYLMEFEDKYVICPSTSPENSFRHAFTIASLDLGTAYDMAIVCESLEFALAITDDQTEQEKLKVYLDNLYPIQKGKYGIREYHKNYVEFEPGHRHFSPLYAFYPSQEIGYNQDKERTQWVSDLFWRRLNKSHQHVGWSAVWAMCIGARLRDVKAEQKVIRHFITNAIFDNLFCFHEPNYFQIDGNFGFVAGLNELLITEEDEKIELLPAILPEYQNGKMENIRIKGAKISFAWKNGKVIFISSDQPITVYKRNLSEHISITDNIKIFEMKR